MALALVLASGPGRAQSGLMDESQAFSLNSTQVARSLAESARDHLAAGRTREALADIQTMLEEHQGEVLGPERPIVAGDPSLEDVHRGTGEDARELLLSLDLEAREVYRERYEQRAAGALAEALERGDAGALAEVAQRWPITHSALRAWWALGDLELERGRAADGLEAWARALAIGTAHSVSLEEPSDWELLVEELGQVEGVPLAATALRAAEARAPLALEQLGRVKTRAESEAWVNALAGTVGDAATSELASPGRSADGWRAAFNLPKDHPFERRSGHPIFSVKSGDTLYLSTTLELFAIAAYTGDLLWRSYEPAGWSELSGSQRSKLFDAIENDSLISPAHGQGVVVAALQVPQTFEREINYGEMNIIKPLPNRRLFAFDAETGEPLWNTAPPPDWDGESGGFAIRTRAAGSPVIRGGRVLVPCVRLRGRIEFSIACFDLFDGSLLWSTAILTGQRERNMFGRSQQEFAAPPVVVAGSRVITQTQLGSIACLDLFTGDTLWESTYPKIPLKAARNFSQPTRARYWRNAPPVIVDGTVVCTPEDGEYLFGLDLATGSMRWQQSHSLLNDLYSSRRGLNLLVGADENTVYLGGAQVTAIEFPSGISQHNSQPHGHPGRRWSFPATGSLSTSPRYAARPVLSAGSVWIPDMGKLYRIDKVTGKLEEETAFEYGNLLVVDGATFSTTAREVTGRFDWKKLLTRARARHEASPEDMHLALEFALLLENRGAAEVDSGDGRSARSHLEEARSVVEAFGGKDPVEAPPPVTGRLHSILRTEAQALRFLGETRLARERLARARTLAPHGEALRDTLLEELELLAPYAFTQAGHEERQAAWVETVTLLLEDCGELLMNVALPQGLGPALRDDDPPRWIDASDDSSFAYTVPVGLWARLARAKHFAATGDSRREFADLFELLAEFGHFRAGDDSVSEWVSNRIGEKVSSGEREGFELYERRAEELLTRATQEHHLRLLESVTDMFPHTRAAEKASDVRLEMTLELGDVGGSAAIVLGSLGNSWTPRASTPRELARLARLAQLFGDAGNNELAAGLLAELAEHHPRTPLPAPFEGSTLTDLLRAREQPATELPAPASASSSFAHGAGLIDPMVFDGEFDWIGEVHPAGDEDHMLVFAGSSLLLGITDAGGQTHVAWRHVLGAGEGQERWRYRFSPPNTLTRSQYFTTTPGRAHIATESRVLTLDRASGEELWSWSIPGAHPEYLSASGGVLIAVVEPPGRAREHYVTALDAELGVELWRLIVDTRALLERPIVGEGRVVFMPDISDEDGQVWDLYTGHALATFRAPNIGKMSGEASWIEDGKLIMPRFLERRRPENNHITAIDLDSTRQAWRCDFGRVNDGMQLTKVLRYQGDSYLVLRPLEGDRLGHSIVQLDTTSGSLAAEPLAELGDSDVLIGLQPKLRTELAAPFLFLNKGPDNRGAVVLRAIHLPYGRRWDTRMRVLEEDLYNPNMPQPALSSTTIAFSWLEQRAGVMNRSPEGKLAFHDRATGAFRGLRDLPRDLSPVELVPLGDALVLCGRDRMEIWR